MPSKPFAGPIQRTKISFFELPTCENKLLQAPKIITSLPQLLSDHKILFRIVSEKHASNPIQ